MVERTGGYVSGPAAAIEPRRVSLESVRSAGRVVLVEGISDQIALDAVAERLLIDLTQSRTLIAPMGGAHAIDTFLDLIGPRSTSARPFTVLCDVAELPVIARAMKRAGCELTGETADDLAAAGCFVCDPDLEAELIAAAGPERVVELIEARGDGSGFRTLQKQAAWRERPLEQQLHRFLRARARRMHHYAKPLVGLAGLDRSLFALRGALGLV